MTTTPQSDPFAGRATSTRPPPQCRCSGRRRRFRPQQGPQVRRWPWAVGGVVLGMALGAGVGGGGASASAPVVAAAPSTVTLPAPPPGPLTSFDDGVYEVGIDIEPGKYKTPGPGSTEILDSCYMEVSDGSGDLEGIEQNDNLTGSGVVTVAEGEYFSVNGGCTWTKAG